MEQLQVTDIINDGQEILKDLVERYKLHDLVRMYNGKYFADFVGVVTYKRMMLFSFPKHYNYKNLNEEKQKHAIRRLTTLFINGISDSTLGTESSFPLEAYLRVLSHYKRYGLYNKVLQERKKGYGGRISWQHTMQKSMKLIQSNGIVYLPFVTICNKQVNVFISECMEYVLGSAYADYGSVMTQIHQYPAKYYNPIFNHYDKCVLKLKRIRQQYFKDLEKQLIDALITFFEWKAKSDSRFYLVTTSFALYWERMINLYLGDYFNGIQDDQILWKNQDGSSLLEDSSAPYTFSKPKPEYIEHQDVVTQGYTPKYQIEFDHLAIVDEDKSVYLMDSKYIARDNFNGLNYKQAFYYYFLKCRYPGYTIYNGLVAPTEKDYMTKVHADRSRKDNQNNLNDGYTDGLKIIEHYINLVKVIDHTLDNLPRFKVLDRE